MFLRLFQNPKSVTFTFFRSSMSKNHRRVGKHYPSFRIMTFSVRQNDKCDKCDKCSRSVRVTTLTIRGLLWYYHRATAGLPSSFNLAATGDERDSLVDGEYSTYHCRLALSACDLHSITTINHTYRHIGLHSYIPFITVVVKSAL